MATVTAMLDRLSYYTGQRSTGIERAMGLAALDSAYNEILSETRCKMSLTTYTFTASSDTYSLSTMLGEVPMRIHGIDHVSSLNRIPLQERPIGDLMQYRQSADTIGEVYYYGLHDFDTISFFPNPDVGDQITIRFVPTPKNLHESTDDASNETTPSMIPPQFHWDVLFPKAVSEVMAKDGRNDDIAFWQEKYEYGMGKLKQYVASLTGQAAPMFDLVSRSVYKYNDQRGRW